MMPVLFARPGLDRRSISYSLLCATACVLVLASRTHSGFERIRYLIPTGAREPATSWTISLPDVTRLSGAPVALVVRAAAAQQPCEIAILLDGAPVGRFSLRANETRRIDASFSVGPGADHVVTFVSPQSAWTLEYLEIANIHGFSRGLLDFVIVPASRPVTSVFPVWVLLPLLLALLIARPQWRWHGRFANVLYPVGSLAVLGVFGAVLLADVATPYKILLSLRTWSVATSVLYAALLVHLWQHVRRLGYSTWVPHAVVTVLFLGSVAQSYEPGAGFTRLIAFGEVFQPRGLPVLEQVPHAVEPGYGYDGQFYAQLALDPLLRTESIKTALDNPSYRSRRILMPWLAAAIGGGRPALVLQAYAVINIVCWLMLGWTLLRWLPPRDARRTAAWAACMYSAGLLVSVRFALPDGPSMLLLTLGLVAAERCRWRLATTVLACAGLARETNLLASVVLIQGSRWSAVRRFVAVGATVVAPLAVWCVYLWTLGLSPREEVPRAFDWPLSGYAEEWIVTLRQLYAEGWESEAWSSAYSQVALTTRAWWLLRQAQWDNLWWRMAFVYLLLIVVLGPAGWEGHPGAITRIGLPLTFAFNVLVTGSPHFWPLWLLGNADALDGLRVLEVAAPSQVL
jgi:hypothetical protein